MSQVVPHPLEQARERSPLAELLILAMPTVAQQASYTLMQFTDTLMLSRIGDAEAAAAGNAGMLAFSLVGLGVGVLLLVNTLVSQAFGRRDYAACGQFLWQGLWFAFAYSLLSLPVALGARLPFEWSGHARELVDSEAVFFRIMIANMFLKLAATVVSQFLVGVNRPGPVLVATLAGVSVNVVANWVLIFGNLGAPALGLAGSAWGTTIALFIELLILVAFIARPSIATTFGLADWRPRWRQMKTLLRLGIPTGGQFVADVLAWTLFMMTVMGLFGTAAMAGNTYAFRFWLVSFMPAFGIASAVTALVGRYIGMGRPDIAARRAHLGFAVSAIYMIACGLVFYFARYQLIGLFTSDPEVLRIGATVLVFAAVYQFFDAMYIVYNNALRGAGDTLVPAIAVLVLCWGLMLFGGYQVARYRPDLGPAGPWMVGALYGIILGVFMFVRFQRGRWKSIDLSDRVRGFDALQPAPGATVTA